MILTVGSKVVYPGQGPCLVGAAEEQVDQALSARKIAVVSGKPNYQPIGELSQSV